ncbi:MAG: hypothetical protein WCW77_01035 [Patescibacteria group bacterium]|jgi:hypothetical protein
MREILTVSLPGETLRELKKRIKSIGFDSVGKYVKCLIERDLEDDWISEDELVEAVKEARAEYKAGKTIKARSMADLL